MITAKHQELKTILSNCGRVALAFSGGVDSSFLLKCALETLGTSNVLALFARSELLPESEVERVLHWPEENGCDQGAAIEVVEVHPLGWKEFVRNAPDRCYSCKRRLYSLFREQMERQGYDCLIDGTNTDDLKERRAGLRAIHELGVRMPLVEARFTKDDVRTLSRQLGLVTWDLPSASCLATRIPDGMPITSQLLRKIAVLESGLNRFALTGCRVRLCRDRPDAVYLEIRNHDFAVLADTGVRLALLRLFQQHGVNKVLLDLVGRG